MWGNFSESDLSFRPHGRSSTVLEIMKHQLLSERRLFGEFLGVPESEAAAVLPVDLSMARLRERMFQLALPRLAFLAGRDQACWLETAHFFDAERQRISIFWRRVLHTAHHRTQRTVYFRLLNESVPATYGPTADVTWDGADPTLSVEAASRKERASPFAD